MSNWSYGIYNEDTDEHFLLVEDVTFPQAIRELLKLAEEDNETKELISNIREIADDPGIMDDPAQWEDFDFYGPNDYIWFVMEQ